MATIQPTPLPPWALYRGATFQPRLAITLDDDIAKDFTGATVRWALLSAGTVSVGEKTIGSGIVYEGDDPTSGIVIVTMTKVESAALAPGDYVQEFHITDGAGDVQIYRGAVCVADADLAA